MIRGATLGQRRRQRGQALVEFAITLPIAVLFILGLIDLGRGVYAYNTLAQSARQATRTAMVDQDVGRVQAVAISTAATLGLTSSNVSVCFKDPYTTEVDCSAPGTEACSPLSIGCLSIVETHMSFAPITPMISALWSSIPLSSISVEAIEYVCPHANHPTCP